MATRTRVEKRQMVIDIEGFLGAAGMPDRADLMAQLEIGQSMLDEGAELVNRWHARKALLDETQLKLDDANKAKRETRSVATLEMTALVMFFRRQYYNDEPLLRSLGLGPKRKSVPVASNETEGAQTSTGQENQTQPPQTGDDQSQEPQTRRVAVPKTQRESERIALWRSMLECIPKLREDVRNRLEIVGFNQQRLDHMKTAVEAFAATLPIKRVAVAERKERIRLLNLVERDLNSWLVVLRAMMTPKIRLIRNQGQQQILALIAA